MPSPLSRRVARSIRARGLWSDADRIAVALSGGADSVALLLLLAELAPRGRWSLAGVIHVHHGLRGTDADADAVFCRELATRLALPIDVVPVDVPAARDRTRRSLESTARGLRYAAFEAAAARLDATVVATAHTADDQAETVLLRLLRGATARGISAVRPRRGPYARPLLDCRRAELRRYLSESAQTFREDASNADVSVPRNRLRHELMPVLEQAWPGGVAALARFADLAADDERLLSELAAAERTRVIRTGANGVELDRDALVALDPALARRVVRDAIELAGGTPVSREIEALRHLAARGSQSGHVDLHGLAAERAGRTVKLGTATRATTGPRLTFEYRLDVPGQVQIEETGGVVRASLSAGPERPALSTGWAAIAALDAASLALPLTVRTRRPGDRFTPLGAPGRRTLQDLLVDRKVPRDERSAVPVVVDAEGRIVWVAGVAMADRCRVGTAVSGMVILEFKKGTL